MAAEKGKGWRSGRREGRSRMVQMTRHLVVSEGKETEPRYFEGVRAALGAANGRKVAIVVKGTGKHTPDLLDFAVEYCRYAPGRPPRQPRQREVLGPEPGDQGRGHIRGAGALPGLK